MEHCNVTQRNSTFHLSPHRTRQRARLCGRGQVEGDMPLGTCPGVLQCGAMQLNKTRQRSVAPDLSHMQPITSKRHLGYRKGGKGEERDTIWSTATHRKGIQFFPLVPTYNPIPVTETLGKEDVGKGLGRVTQLEAMQRKAKQCDPIQRSAMQLLSSPASRTRHRNHRANNYV